MVMVSVMDFVGLHVVRYSWKLYLSRIIFVGFGQLYQGMFNTLQNNKAPITL